MYKKSIKKTKLQLKNLCNGKIAYKIFQKKSKNIQNIYLNIMHKKCIIINDF